MRAICDPITLADDALLAQGGGRLVFAHPDRRDVVVKVARTAPPKRRLLSRSAAFGPLWNSHVEIREFTRSVSAIGRVTPIYAQFLGFVQTNRGTGAMFEAIRTRDGTLAPTLTNHVARNGIEPEMERALQALWDEIKETWLIISDPSLDNIVVTGDAAAGYDLVIVDGIGERVLIPIQAWSRRVHAKKCVRQAAAMIAGYHALDGAGQAG